MLAFGVRRSLPFSGGWIPVAALLQDTLQRIFTFPDQRRGGVYGFALSFEREY